jgi:hypothetical protein
MDEFRTLKWIDEIDRPELIITQVMQLFRLTIKEFKE